MSEHWATQAEAQMRQHEEKTSLPQYIEGDVVLVSKPFFERGTGAILPQSDGPYLIARLPTPHTAILEDIYSGDLYQGGKSVAINRLIRYAYLVEWVREHEPMEDIDQPLIQRLNLGDFVAIEPRTQQNKRIYVAKVRNVIREQGMVEVSLYHVPAHARYGPWQRRPWTLWSNPDGQPRVEVVPASEVLCQVNLKNDALDLASLTSLAQCGVDVGSMPHRDHSLPPVTF